MRRPHAVKENRWALSSATSVAASASRAASRNCAGSGHMRRPHATPAPTPFQQFAALLSLLAYGVLAVAVVWGLLVLLLAMGGPK